MKVKFILIIAILLLLFSCNKKIKPRVFIDIDNSEGEQLQWKKAKFISKCKELILGIDKNITVTVLDSTSDFEILTKNLFDYGKLSITKETKKTKYLDYILCVRPQINYKNKVEYSAVFASANYKKKNVNQIEQCFNNTDLILAAVKKNFPNEDDIKPVFFVWNKKKLRISLVTDASSDVDWDKEKYVNSIKHLFGDNINKRIIFSEVNKSLDTTQIKTEPTKIFNELGIQADKDENVYLFYIKPYIDDRDNSDKFELAFFTSAADANNIEIIKSATAVPQNILDKIASSFVDSSFANPDKIYLWLAPEHISTSIFSYKSFKDIETLRGTYLLVENIPDIITGGRLEITDILEGNNFIPQDNKMCKDIIDYFVSHNSYSFFYDQNKNLKDIRVVFVEYITTGNRYILTLIGPISEDNFDNDKAFLKERKIKTHSKLIYPYDLK